MIFNMKIITKNFLYILLSMFLFEAGAQTKSIDTYWKKTRNELFVNAGASQFLGDLGGLNKQGTDYSIADLEYSLTKPSMAFGYRHKFTKHFSTSACFNYLMISGDDKLTTDIYRNNRNLNFKSNIFELTVRGELSLYKKGSIGHIYDLKKVGRTIKQKKIHEYVFFTGIGAFYFNPKGKDAITNQWIALRPLHTEGEGLAGGPKEYSQVSICIPIGLKYKLLIDNVWSVGIELCYRKTFTDYIDDVSTVYYNPTLLQNAYGNKALQMSDPSLGNIPGATLPNADGSGAQRGDKQKDSYLTLQISVGYYWNKKIRHGKLRSKM